MLPREDTKKNGLPGFSVAPAPEFYNFVNILIKNDIWGKVALAGKRVLLYIGFKSIPMKIRNTLSACFFLLAGLVSQAQPDTAKISQRALMYADSVIRTDAYGNDHLYTGLVPASVLKYYGGADGYMQHVYQLKGRTTGDQEELYPVITLETLRTLDQQWQCVVRVSRYFHRESVQYHYTTYLVGQSKDEGETWRMLDVSYNLVANMILIFPEVFPDLPIKQPEILSQAQEEKLAQQQTAAAGQGAKKARK